MHRLFSPKVLACIVAFGGCASVAAANEVNHSLSLESVQESIDYVWVMVAAAMVFMMQPGFMCLESGLARAKNSINVSIKNLADVLIAIAAFWIVGFGLMFGISHTGLFGTTEFMSDFADKPWFALFFVFQAVFCGTAATIDSGAVAERTRFLAYLFMSAVVSAFIYPIFGHWAWGGMLHTGSQGWLGSLGFVDFAGSTVVHSVGAWVALAGVIIVGPRIGKFDENGKPQRIHPHSLPFAFLGTFLLFFGWFGFNCGSTLSATPKIASIAMTTVIAAAFGGITSTVADKFLSKDKRPHAEMMANGVIGGLVAITAGCASVSPFSAAIIGSVAGLVVYGGILFLEHILKLDDVVGAIPVHGFCGVWGTLAVALFMRYELLTQTGLTRLELFTVQAIGVAACFVWTFGLAWLTLKTFNRFIAIRVTEEDEQAGLNVAEHGAVSTLLDLATGMHQAALSTTYDESLKVTVEKGTEVGDLAEAFNNLIDTIRQEKVLTDNAEKRFWQQYTEVKKAKKDLSHAQYATIVAMSKMAEARDDDTGKHIERTQSYCKALAEKLKGREEFKGQIDDVFIQNLVNASSLHDIGKVAIPDNILQKPGKLTDDEFEFMKQHTVFGAQTLASVLESYPENQFLAMGMSIAKSHHEKWDGSGYPEGLKEDEIPLAAQIMAIADVYDALRSERCYKDAFSHEKSCAIILDGAGSHFSPVLCEVFREISDEFEEISYHLSDQIKSLDDMLEYV